MSASLAAAYDATASGWQRGPGRIYDRLARELVGRCPALDDSSSVLDVGAGTGAATRAIRRRGARVVAIDTAFDMLRHGPPGVPICVADARALPFADGAFDAVVAAFSINHVATPAAALREAGRVTRPGGSIVVSVYAADDEHPAKRVVDEAAAAAGWTAPEWYQGLRSMAMPLMATVDRAVGVATCAGLTDAVAEEVRVAIPDLSARDLVAWRLGMAHLAPFIGQLDLLARRRVWSDACARLAGAPMLVRSIIVLTAGPSPSQRS